ncbi:hypothetical protein DMENIID0001_081550 [Sergentomyia squamirostris]
MNTRSKNTEPASKTGAAPSAPSSPEIEPTHHEPQGAAANTERPPSCQTIRSSSMEEDFVESPPRSSSVPPSVPPSAPPSDAGHGDAMLTIDRRTRNLPDLTTGGGGAAEARVRRKELIVSSIHGLMAEARTDKVEGIGMKSETKQKEKLSQ